MILFGTKVGRIICDYFINCYENTGSTFKKCCSACNIYYYLNFSEQCHITVDQMVLVL